MLFPNQSQCIESANNRFILSPPRGRCGTLARCGGFACAAVAFAANIPHLAHHIGRQQGTHGLANERFHKIIGGIRQDLFGSAILGELAAGGEDRNIIAEE